MRKVESRRNNGFHPYIAMMKDASADESTGQVPVNFSNTLLGCERVDISRHCYVCC